MSYAFYFMTTANAHGIFSFFVKSEGTCACVLLCFCDFISFGPKLWVYKFIYTALYSL